MPTPLRLVIFGARTLLLLGMSMFWHGCATAPFVKLCQPTKVRVSVPHTNGVKDMIVTAGTLQGHSSQAINFNPIDGPCKVKITGPNVSPLRRSNAVELQIPAGSDHTDIEITFRDSGYAGQTILFYFEAADNTAGVLAVAIDPKVPNPKCDPSPNCKTVLLKTVRTPIGPTRH